MKYATFDDIKQFLVKHKITVNSKPNYGLIGVNQRDQFANISLNGIPILLYNYKTDLKHTYKVWTFISGAEAKKVYNDLLVHFHPDLKESPLSDSENLEDSPAYIYVI